MLVKYKTLHYNTLSLSRPPPSSLSFSLTYFEVCWRLSEHKGTQRDEPGHCRGRTKGTSEGDDKIERGRKSERKTGDERERQREGERQVTRERDRKREKDR